MKKGKLIEESESYIKSRNKGKRYVSLILIIISISNIFGVSFFLFKYKPFFLLLLILIITIFLFLILFIIAFSYIVATDVVSIYSRGILLPSKKYMFMTKDKNGEIIVQFSNQIIGSHRKFIYYQQIITLSYQENEKTKEQIITLNNIDQNIVKKIPNKLYFITINTKTGDKNYLFQILIEKLNLKKILKYIIDLK